jgi:hypothetical protein
LWDNGCLFSCGDMITKEVYEFWLYVYFFIIKST